MMVEDDINITNIVKHKVYRASLMGWGEVKKWMELDVYDPVSELAWCYFHIFERRRLIVC